MPSPKKERSFVEFGALDVNDFSSGLKLSKVIEATKYDLISEEDKGDIIVLKEAFVFLDPRLRRIGVFTRSDRDHGTKIGQCSTILCGNFDRRECTITNDKSIIYDVKDRLHRYAKEISGLFVESKRSEIPTIYYHDKDRGKRYLFLIFQLSCSARDMPLYYRLENRAEDLFIGMHDLPDVSRGLERYNRSNFDVDKAVVAGIPEKRWFLPTSFSITEKLFEAKIASPSFTLVKFNVVGI